MGCVMIPAKYNVRNLRVRWMTTLMTVLSTGLVVWASVLCFGLTDGLRYALQVTGHELDLIVLRKGSADEIGSGLEQKVAREVSTLSGIAKDGEGRRWSTMAFVTTEDGEQNLDQWENEDVSAIEAGMLADKFEKEICQ